MKDKQGKNRIAEFMNKEVKRIKVRKKSLWGGPEVEGITFSLLSRFLACRERFRIMVIEGLRPIDTFNHRLEYGNMWHLCEEAFAEDSTSNKWNDDLLHYSERLCRKYPTQQEDVRKWYNVCRIQFPIYVDFWENHPDVKSRTPILQEQVFNIPYVLPSSKVVRLRGKLDSVDIIGKGNNAGIHLQENKTKADINEVRIRQQLTFDLQTMLYMVALHEIRKKDNRKFLPRKVDERFFTLPIRGVRYNVVRRPLGGGRNSIRQGKDEYLESFYRRLENVIASEPEFFFMRWNSDILPQEVERFKVECLNPILEELCRWWEWIQDNRSRPFTEGGINNVHWVYPFGVYNPLNDGNASEFDGYLLNGSDVGLETVNNLFPELTPLDDT